MVFAHIHYNRYFEFGRVLCIDFFLPSHKNIHPFSLSNFWGAYQKVITIKDDAFIKRLIDILNELIEKCKDIEYSPREDFSGGELPAIKNEIENLFINPSKNEEKIREKINEHFSEIYNKADKNTGKTMRIKSALKNVVPQTEFSPKLLSSVAEAIKLYSDGEVGIILINGSEIRR